MVVPAVPVRWEQAAAVLAKWIRRARGQLLWEAQAVEPVVARAGPVELVPVVVPAAPDKWEPAVV